jgi:hypothetical protein
MSNPSEDDWKRMLKLVDTYFQKPEAGAYVVGTMVDVVYAVAK